MNTTIIISVKKVENEQRRKIETDWQAWCCTTTQETTDD